LSLECSGRWASYCLSLAVSSLVALAWFLKPSIVTTVLIVSTSSLSLAYALGAREGLLWSPFLALWASLYLLGGHLHLASLLALAGSLAVLLSSRRPLALALAALASPLLGDSFYAGLAVAVLAVLGPVLESGKLHSASLIVIAPLFVVLGEEWGLLLAASFIVASEYVGNPLADERCPFRLENSLLLMSIALISVSIILELLSRRSPGEYTLYAAEALWVTGYTLESGALLVPKGLGVLLREAEAESSTISVEPLT
jgi:hypothetical protein